MSLFSQSGITSVAADATVAVLIALLSVASFVCLVVFLCRFADDTAPVKRKSVALLAIFGAGAVVRLTFAFCIRGYRADYALFTDMFDNLKTSGLGGYYSGDASEVLYPTAYFVYLIFGGLANVTGLGDFALGTQFAVKLPLIIADLAAAYAVYLLASRYFNRRVALTLCVGVRVSRVLYGLGYLVHSDSIYRVLYLLCLLLCGAQKLRPRNRVCDRRRVFEQGGNLYFPDFARVLRVPPRARID